MPLHCKAFARLNDCSNWGEVDITFVFKRENCKVSISKIFQQMIKSLPYLGPFRTILCLNNGSLICMGHELYRSWVILHLIIMNKIKSYGSIRHTHNVYTFDKPNYAWNQHNSETKKFCFCFIVSQKALANQATTALQGKFGTQYFVGMSGPDMCKYYENSVHLMMPRTLSFTRSAGGHSSLR